MGQLWNHMYWFHIKAKLYFINFIISCHRNAMKTQPTTPCSFLHKLLCLILGVGRKPNLFSGFKSLDECSVCEVKVTTFKEVTMVRGRSCTSEVTSYTALPSKGMPYWMWAIRGALYVQVMENAERQTSFSVSRIALVLSINCLS